MITGDELVEVHNAVAELFGGEDGMSIEDWLESRQIELDGFEEMLGTLVGQILQNVTSLIVMQGDMIGEQEHCTQLSKAGVMSGFFLAFELARKQRDESLVEANEAIQQWISTHGAEVPTGLLKLTSDLDHALTEGT